MAIKITGRTRFGPIPSETTTTTSTTTSTTTATPTTTSTTTSTTTAAPTTTTSTTTSTTTAAPTTTTTTSTTTSTTTAAPTTTTSTTTTTTTAGTYRISVYGANQYTPANNTPGNNSFNIQYTQNYPNYFNLATDIATTSCTSFGYIDIAAGSTISFRIVNSGTVSPIIFDRSYTSVCPSLTYAYCAEAIVNIASDVSLAFTVQVDYTTGLYSFC